MSTSSQQEQTPQTTKVKSLPADLRKIADDLIAEKEGKEIVSPSTMGQLPPCDEIVICDFWVNEPLTHWELQELIQFIEANNSYKFKQTLYEDRNVWNGHKKYTELSLDIHFSSKKGNIVVTSVSPEIRPATWYAQDIYRQLKMTGMKWQLLRY